MKEGIKTKISATELNRIREYLEEQNRKWEAWVAEDPENRFAGTLAVDGILEDLNEWVDDEAHFILSLEDYLRHEEWINYYEGHKDVYGCKARWTHWTDHTLEEWEEMNRDLARAAETERESKREARVARKLAKIRRKKEDEAHKATVRNILDIEVTLENPVLF